MTTRRTVLLIGHVVLGLGLAIVFALLFGWVVMVAWNAAIPDLLHLPGLSYWQAVALLVLVRVLTGRFTHGSHPRHGCGRLPHGTGPDSAALFTAWWDQEGEVAFNEYVRRQTGGTERD